MHGFPRRSIHRSLVFRTPQIYFELPVTKWSSRYVDPEHTSSDILGHGGRRSCLSRDPVSASRRFQKFGGGSR